MSTPEEPSEPPSESDSERKIVDTVSLVDLIDQFDRDAFRRALRHRDTVYRIDTNRQS